MTNSLKLHLIPTSHPSANPTISLLPFAPLSTKINVVYYTIFQGEQTLDECMKQFRYTLVTEVSTMVKITDIPKEDRSELAFTKEEITELERAKSMPITFDEDCPETTPERALKFRRVNPVRRTAN